MPKKPVNASSQQARITRALLRENRDQVTALQEDVVKLIISKYAKLAPSVVGTALLHYTAQVGYVVGMNGRSFASAAKEAFKEAARKAQQLQQKAQQKTQKGN
jgi:hypothetical protein